MYKLKNVKVIMRKVLSGLMIVLAFFTSTLVTAIDYGEGSYGTCTYGTCGITISSTSPVNIALTPQTGQTRCSVQKDVITVTTGASVGYTMTLSSTGAGTTMSGVSNGGNIAAVATSYGSPGVLSANRWGYRIDGTGSFGAGPTSAQTSGVVPSETYAPVPALSSPQTIRTTAVAAAPSISDVWYGVCADMSIPADTYTADVVYTASTN